MKAFIANLIRLWMKLGTQQSAEQIHLGVKDWLPSLHLLPSFRGVAHDEWPNKH